MIEEIRKIKLEELEAKKRELENLKMNDELEKIEQEISLYRTTNDVSLLIPSMLDAIQLLESHGIQPTLCEADMNIEYKYNGLKRDYTSKSSLMCVHKRHDIPYNNTILTSKNSKATKTMTVYIKDIKYTIYYENPRDTIHMALNNEVASHDLGNWDDCKYAIFIPFNEIANERIGNARQDDTYVRGNLELSENCWILCPEGEVDTVKAQNSKLHVLGYEGERVLGYPCILLKNLGYYPEIIEGHSGWRESGNNNKQFMELCRNEKLSRKTHYDSQERINETKLEVINRIVELSKFLRENNLIKNFEDIENIMLNSSSNVYSYYSHILYDESNFWDREKFDFYIEILNQNGIEITSGYQKALIMLCENKKLPNIPQEASFDEKNAIHKLQLSLLNRGMSDSVKEIATKFFITAIGNSILHEQEKVNLDKANLSEHQMFIDNFVLDLKNKTLKSYDLSYEDSFLDEFEDGTINQIDIESDDENKTKKITINTANSKEPYIITINEKNQIIGLESKAILEIGTDFLKYNTTLENLILPRVDIIGENFLESNTSLKKLIVPNLMNFRKGFLSNHKNGIQINAPECPELCERFQGGIIPAPKDIALLARDSEITSAEIEESEQVISGIIEKGKGNREDESITV